MRMKNSAALIMAAVMCLAASPREHIPAGSARNFIGQEQTVCGTVSEVVNKPYGSFINMGGHYLYPNNGKPLLVPDFTMVLWERNRTRLEIDPTSEFGGKEVCVHGLITRYTWRRPRPRVEIPQIELTSIDQYSLNGKEND